MAGSYATSVSRKELWNRNFILIMLANCSLSIGFQMIMPPLPIYIQEFGATQEIVGLLVGIFTVTAVTFRPFIGRAVDKWNRRNIYLFGILINTISIVGYNIAPTLKVLLVFRLLHGLGWSITTTAASTIATDSIPRQRIVEGMGYYGLNNVFSMAVAPALGLHIIKVWSFSNLFYSSIVLTVTGAVISLFIFCRKVPAAGRENKTNVKPGLFEKKAFTPTVIYFFIGLTLSSIVTFIALYAAQLNIGNIGVFFTVFAVTSLVSRLLSGRLADRKGFDYVMVPGIILVGISMVFLSSADCLLVFIIAAVTYGIGSGLVQPSLQAMAVRDVLPERRGVANSTFFIGADLAMGLGAMAWGMVAGCTGYSTMYLLAVIPVVIAFSIYFFAGRKELLRVDRAK